MQSFLQHVARDLYTRMHGDFQDVTVVFPNKRAALFFNAYLWECSAGRAMWTPQYTTISELFASLSPMIVGDPVFLVSQLHEVYRRHLPNEEKSFDELYPLLEMMLADFQDVDSNMVAADKIFRNVRELQELSDYSFLEHEQVEAIRHFFNGLKWQQGTVVKRHFTTLWDKLLDIYTDYRAQLLAAADPMVYEGMLKRDVAERLKSGGTDRLAAKHYAFVGFNVLNRTEKELFRHIKQELQTLFYWDYDIAFCSGSMDETAGDARFHGAEAGRFILENIHDFGSVFTPDAPVCRNMAAQPKDITFIQSPTENAQARYVGTWLKEKLAESPRGNDGTDARKQPFQPKLTDYAVVLCNESLLQPVLHSIPANVDSAAGENKITLNVTMGYPLCETPAYSLVQTLLELQLRGRTRSGSWRYKQVAAVLKHPYLRRMSCGKANDTLLKLASANILFPTDAAFADDDLMRTVFTQHRGKELTAYLSDVLTRASQSLCQPKPGSAWDDALYRESIFAAYTAINRIHSMQETIPSLSELSDNTIARLVYQALQRVSVPFHGEPADGLQVMGFLETRNLDFRHVVLLSASEELMPRAAKRPSLIPYSLQSAFGMTTIDKEVSIYAYYFFRLLARAESVTVLWNASTEDGHKGEMSRFMLQMLMESERLFHPAQEIKLRQFTAPMETMATAPLAVRKSDEVMRRLRERFSSSPTGQTTPRILSPSALNCYLRCPLQFFFRYVARLRPDDDMAEDIDDAIFGDIFHYVMEQLYRPHIGRPLTSSQLKAMARDDKRLRQLVDEGFMVKLFKYTAEEGRERLKVKQIQYSGSQLIKHHVLRSLLRMQLLADAHTAEEAERTGGGLKILAVEDNSNYVDRDFRPQGCDEPITVRLGGVIDRIDMVDNGSGEKTIRVVDYKTSSRPQTATNVAQLFDSAKAGSCYHITQTLYYCDILCETGAYGADRVPVVPAIMYYKNNCHLISPVVQLYDSKTDKQPRQKPYIQSYIDDCRGDFHPLMMQTIENIFSPNSHFAATEDSHNCQFCDFRQLCRVRKGKNL